MYSWQQHYNEPLPRAGILLSLQSFTGPGIINIFDEWSVGVFWGYRG